MTTTVTTSRRQFLGASTGLVVGFTGKFFAVAILLAALAAVVAAYLIFDLGQYLTLDGIKRVVGQWEAFYADNPAKVLAGFFVAYVAVTAASLPGHDRVAVGRPARSAGLVTNRPGRPEEPEEKPATIPGQTSPEPPQTATRRTARAGSPAMRTP